MNPEVGKAWFQIALFILIVSGVLLFVTTPGSAEFVVSVTAFVIGVLFLAAVIFAVRRANR